MGPYQTHNCPVSPVMSTARSAVASAWAALRPALRGTSMRSQACRVAVTSACSPAPRSSTVAPA
eukprot:2354681-Lingulodinium_polyedra.AAC.1